MADLDDEPQQEAVDTSTPAANRQSMAHVSDYAGVDESISLSDVKNLPQALQVVQTIREQDQAEHAVSHNVVLSKSDVELMMQELEMTKDQAESLLRQAQGDLVLAWQQFCAV